MTRSISLFARLRRRLAGESGFTMIIALGVLLVTSLLLTATFVALDGNSHLSQSDLDGKRAYYAARAGLDAYLYHLNQDATYWQTCANDTTSGWVSVPGNTTGEKYQYSAVAANGNSSCSNTNIVNTMIDSSSGVLTMQFWGSSGANPTVTRGIVASFRRASPLDYLWYTVYESLDSSVSGYSDCAVWYRQTRASHCNINWITGDVINGSMYSQDQFLISSGDAPVFGRSGAGDHIETAATTSVCDNSSCGNATFNGTQDTGIDVPEPSDNAGLATDAANHGKVYTGTTTITLSGTTATITNCPSTCTTYNNVSLGTYPIIYVQNGSSCSPPAYTPFGPSYTTTGCAGDVYVQGSYSTSVTIAAANNIIVTGNITTSSSGGSLTGNAVLGLVANQFVRVQHDVPTRPSNSSGSCPSSADTTDLNNLTIDAAILALSHSFIVDNYDCGYPASTSAPLGTLTVNGSIVQKFRGTVGARYAVSNNGTWTTYMTGYLKNYTYDDRLKSLTPPYLFDIFTAGWNLSRENLCVTSGGSAQSAC